METLTLPPDSPLVPLLDRQPTLVVFLRHFNCTFCREAIADVAGRRVELERAGVAIAFVHPSPALESEPWFRQAGLADVLRVSDPSLAHYRAFELGATGVASLLSPRLWARGASCALAHGFGVQPPHLLLQLAGVFVAHQRRVLASFRHSSPSDRPDYLALAASGQRDGAQSDSTMR